MYTAVHLFQPPQDYGFSRFFIDEGLYNPFWTQRTVSALERCVYYKGICIKGNFNGCFCQMQCNHTKPSTQVVFSE